MGSLLIAVSFLVVVYGVVDGEVGISSRKLDDEAGLASNDSEHTYWLCHAGKAFPSGGGRINMTTCGNACDASGGKKQYVGYICALIAIVFFGSNFIPVKKYDTGDGVFFQWVLCVGIWLVGLVTNLSLNSPPFFIPTIIGGALWTSANLMVVPIIKMIGLTMGLTVWGVTNMLTGWIIGTFFLDQPVTCSKLSYVGVATIVVSVFILAFVKSEGKRSTKSHQLGEKNALLGKKTDGTVNDKMSHGGERYRRTSTNSNLLAFSPSNLVGATLSVSTHLDSGVEDLDKSWVDKLGVWQKRILGFAISLVTGIVFSFITLPVQYLKLCDDPFHSCNDIDYLFGVYSGILITSSFYFIAYSVLNKNRPKVYPSVILPGIISGIILGIAMLSWFEANENLSLAISFPLITGGPGFVSSAWGILLYREIKGWRNIVLYLVAFGVSLSGLIMNGLSKCIIHC